MSSHGVELVSWSAWAAGIDSISAWKEWAENPRVLDEIAAPKIPFIPAKVRRRCSAVAKMMLWTSQGLCTAEELSAVPTVFVTQGGEAETSYALLEEIAKEEVVSPLKFSLSVHNASAGLFSMSHNNRERSTTISVGNDSFAAGLFEAICQLHTGTNEQILLVYGDEFLPEDLKNNYMPRSFHCALSLLLRPRKESADSVSISLAESGSCEASDDLPQALSFIAWLLSKHSASALSAPGVSLLCQKSDVLAEQLFKQAE